MGAVLTKNPEFARDLYDIIFNSLTEEEFERLWAYMLNEHKVHHLKYLRVMYENRKKNCASLLQEQLLPIHLFNISQ